MYQNLINQNNRSRKRDKGSVKGKADIEKGKPSKVVNGNVEKDVFGERGVKTG